MPKAKEGVLSQLASRETPKILAFSSLFLPVPVRSSNPLRCS